MATGQPEMYPSENIIEDMDIKGLVIMWTKTINYDLGKDWQYAS